MSTNDCYPQYNLRQTKYNLQISSSKSTEKLLGYTSCGTHEGLLSFGVATHTTCWHLDCMYCNWVLAYVDTGTNDSPIVIYTSIDTEGYHWSVGDSGLHLEKNSDRFYDDVNNWFYLDKSGTISPHNSTNIVLFDSATGTSRLGHNSEETETVTSTFNFLVQEVEL